MEPKPEIGKPFPYDSHQLDKRLAQAKQQMKITQDDEIWVDTFLRWLDLHALKWGYARQVYDEQPL